MMSVRTSHVKSTDTYVSKPIEVDRYIFDGRSDSREHDTGSCVTFQNQWYRDVIYVEAATRYTYCMNGRAPASGHKPKN